MDDLIKSLREPDAMLFHIGRSAPLHWVRHLLGPGLHLPAPHTSVLGVNHLAHKCHPYAL
jgi:hypothetical protein